MARHNPNAPAHTPLPQSQLRDLLWPNLEPTEEEVREIEQEELDVSERDEDDNARPRLH